MERLNKTRRFETVIVRWIERALRSVIETHILSLSNEIITR